MLTADMLRTMPTADLADALTAHARRLPGYSTVAAVQIIADYDGGVILNAPFVRRALSLRNEDVLLAWPELADHDEQYLLTDGQRYALRLACALGAGTPIAHLDNAADIWAAEDNPLASRAVILAALRVALGYPLDTTR